MVDNFHHVSALFQKRKRYTKKGFLKVLGLVVPITRIFSVLENGCSVDYNFVIGNTAYRLVALFAKALKYPYRALNFDFLFRILFLGKIKLRPYALTARHYDAVDAEKTVLIAVKFVAL